MHIVQTNIYSTFIIIFLLTTQSLISVPIPLTNPMMNCILPVVSLYYQNSSKYCWFAYYRWWACLSKQKKQVLYTTAAYTSPDAAFTNRCRMKKSRPSFIITLYLNILYINIFFGILFLKRTSIISAHIRLF